MFDKDFVLGARHLGTGVKETSVTSFHELLFECDGIGNGFVAVVADGQSFQFGVKLGNATVCQQEQQV